MPPILNFNQIRPAAECGYIGAYISIPTFSYVGPIWKGVSEIVCQFNYSATRNFVLRGRPLAPVAANYAAVIKYRIGYTVYRYKLWEGIGEVTPNVELYRGQVIKKNFVIEIWNVASSNAVNGDAMNVQLGSRKIPDNNYSSLADYEDGDPGELVSPDELVINSATQTTPDTTGLAAWYKGDVADPLADQSGNGKNLAGATFNANLTFGSNAIQGGWWTGHTGFGANITPIKNVWFVLKQDVWNLGGIPMMGWYNLAASTGTYLITDNITPEVRAEQGIDASAAPNVNMVLGTDYIVEFFANSNPGGFGDTRGFRLYDLYGGGLIATKPIGTLVTGLADFNSLYDMLVYVQAAEMLFYTSYQDETIRQTMLRYLMSRYNSDVILQEELTITGDAAWLDNAP